MDEKTIEIDDTRESTDTTDGADVSEVGGDDDSDESVGTRLHRIREHSVDGARVEGQVTDIEPEGDRVTFEVKRLTNGEVVYETLLIPDPWSGSSKLAHLLDEYGYEPSSIDMMEGETVELTRRFGEWRLADPSRGKAVGSMYRKALAGGIFFFSLFFGPVVYFAATSGDIIPLLVVGIIMGPLALVYFGALFGFKSVWDSLF